MQYNEQHLIQMTNGIRRNDWSFVRDVDKLLCLDPGETTGYVVIENIQAKQPTVTQVGQLKTKTVPDMIKVLPPFTTHVDAVIFEKYHIYGWKADDHKFSDVPTLRLIGCIEALCALQGRPYGSQSAQNAKGFATDDMLKQLDLYECTRKGGLRHARDAIRHGVFFLAFGKLP